MNGVNTGATMPRDGMFIRVLTSSYDPSKGGAGVQSNYIVPPLGVLGTRSLRVTYEAPALEWTTPDADRLGHRYTLPIVSGTLASYFGRGHGWLPAEQSTNFQFSRKTSDLVSLTSVNGASLAAIGVAPDSATRLIATLSQLGIPARVSAVPSERVSSQGSFVTRLTFSRAGGGSYTSDPYARGMTHSAGGSSGAIASRDFYMVINGSWSDDQAASVTPTSLPSHGGDVRRVKGTIQANLTTDVGPTVNEFSSAVNAGSLRSEPYLNLPSASVLLQSQLPDGRSAYTTLRRPVLVPARATPTTTHGRRSTRSSG